MLNPALVTQESQLTRPALVIHPLLTQQSDNPLDSERPARFGGLGRSLIFLFAPMPVRRGVMVNSGQKPKHLDTL